MKQHGFLDEPREADGTPRMIDSGTSWVLTKIDWYEDDILGMSKI